MSILTSDVQSIQYDRIKLPHEVLITQIPHEHGKETGRSVKSRLGFGLTTQDKLPLESKNQHQYTELP